MFREIGFTDAVDVAFMTCLIYFVILSFKRSRAAFVLIGMLIIAATYFIAQQFNMTLTTAVFQWFFAVILLAWVVIFQEEIRRFFEQVAKWSFRPGTIHPAGAPSLHDLTPTLVRTLFDLAKDRIGALVVLCGNSAVGRSLEGGIALEGALSEALLKSIFDPHSAGHDGAVVMDGNRVVKFAVHLPLSKNYDALHSGGTRHAAARGISETTDALALVVSEERGTVSIARHGEIRIIGNAEELAAVINEFYDEISPAPKKGFGWREALKKNSREKIISLALACLLWFVQVYGSKITYKTITVPVEYAELSRDLAITSVDPREVEATFAGPRRVLYFLSRDKVKLVLKTLNLKEGTRALKISGSNLSFPHTVRLENVDPPVVTVTIEKISDGEPQKQGRMNATHKTDLL